MRGRGPADDVCCPRIGAGQSARGVLASGAVRHGDGTAGVRGGTAARPGVGHHRRSAQCGAVAGALHLAQPRHPNTDVIIAAALVAGSVVNVELGRLLEGGTVAAQRPHKALSAWPMAAAILLPSFYLVPIVALGVPARPAARDAGGAVEMDRVRRLPGLRGGHRGRRRRDRWRWRAADVVVRSARPVVHRRRRADLPAGRVGDAVGVRLPQYPAGRGLAAQDTRRPVVLRHRGRRADPGCADRITRARTLPGSSSC